MSLSDHTHDGTEEQNKKEFDRWFMEIVFNQKTCAYRDVLRNCRKQLFESWMKERPMWFAKEENG